MRIENGVMIVFADPGIWSGGDGHQCNNATDPKKLVGVPERGAGCLEWVHPEEPKRGVRALESILVPVGIW